MQHHFRTQNNDLTDSGVSEVIGAILLISVVIAAVAIVGVALFSQSTPQEIPNVNFMTGTDNGNNLYLYHNGGDSLTTGTFSVLVDGVVHNYTVSGGGNTWSLGKNLVISGITSGQQHSVAIIYNATGGGAPGSGGIIIQSGTASNITSASPVNNLDVITASAYPPVISVPQLVQNVSSRSVVFYRENNTALSQTITPYLQFTITQPNSTIAWSSASCLASNPLKLNVSDVVTITQPNSYNQSFRIAGIGNQLWELTAANVNLNVADPYGNTVCNNILINNTVITGYSNFQSTVTLTTATSLGSYYTGLTKYNYLVNTTPQLTSQLINGLNNSQIYIYNVSPGSVGFFVLQYDNTTKSTFFAGNTTQVTVNGNQVYP
ncbi:type IV pilin N-terminal domain-containing protein [Methanoregula sp.]|uniref:type IV pilin N-terminal domain-containing protein n=1 Tax=Methanoregula sp. TaxID=2052170 RepID=UPI003C74AF3B